MEQREIGELDCTEDELAALLETYHFHEFSLRGSGRAFHYRNGLLVVRNRQSVLNQLNLKLLLLEWDGGIQAVLNRARGRDALHEAERACVALDYVAAEAWCLDAIRLDPGNDQAKELRLKIEFELGKRPAPVDDETVAVMQARPQRRRELVEAEMAALEESHDWCTRHNAAVEGLAGMQFTLSVPPSRVRKVLTWIEWIDDDSLRERWRLRLESWLP